jgi:hypothetical protein
MDRFIKSHYDVINLRFRNAASYGGPLMSRTKRLVVFGVYLTKLFVSRLFAASKKKINMNQLMA